MNDIRFVWVAAVLVLFAQTGTAQASCAPGAARIQMKGPEATSIKVLLDLVPKEISVSSPFAVRVTTCAEGASPIKNLTIDATMPRHRHGMNYLPVLKKTGSGSYTASGMLFHMPGLWRIEVAVSAGGKRQRFFHEIEVE